MSPNRTNKHINPGGENLKGGEVWIIIRNDRGKVNRGNSLTQKKSISGKRDEERSLYERTFLKNCGRQGPTKERNTFPVKGVIRKGLLGSQQKESHQERAGK